MHIAKKLSAILFGCMLAAGCSDSAQMTEPRLQAPDAAAFDGIGWAGSGNRSDSTALQPAGTGSTGGGNLVGSDSTSFMGIGWAGSGN